MAKRDTNIHIPQTKRGERRKHVPGRKIMSPALRAMVREEECNMRRQALKVPGLVRTVEQIESEQLDAEFATEMSDLADDILRPPRHPDASLQLEELMGHQFAKELEADGTETPSQAQREHDEIDGQAYGYWKKE